LSPCQEAIKSCYKQINNIELERIIKNANFPKKEKGLVGKPPERSGGGKESRATERGMGVRELGSGLRL